MNFYTVWNLLRIQGFNRIVENPVYRFFRAEELQQIVVGAVVIDWKQIEDNAKYHDGWFFSLLTTELKFKIILE